MNAVDFFCGGGGMTRGLLNAGINVVLGVDFNPACEKTYTENNHVPYLCKSITDISVKKLKKDYPILKDRKELLLVGCAPCQPFSKQRRSTEEHVATNLLDEFGRIVDGLKPACVLVENVPGIEKKGHEVFQRFLDVLEKNKYKIFYDVLYAADYGVAQKRKRLVLIASKEFIPGAPPKTHGEGLLPYVTVRDRIGKYPKIEAGGKDERYYNHQACQLSLDNLKRIRATPPNGGSRTSWDDDLILECHKDGHGGHTDVYGRMAWNDVAPTLTSKCHSLSNGRFGHPEQNRAISLREAAALQSFDDDYRFYGSVQEIGRQIGNAVPVLLAQRIGEYILKEHEKTGQYHD